MVSSPGGGVEDMDRTQWMYVLALCGVLWVVAQALKFKRYQQKRAHTPGGSKRLARQQEWHNRRVHETQADDDACAACDSALIEMLELGVYRCTECGHTGGSRYPEWYAQKTRDQQTQWSPQKRRATAAALLRDVTLTLTSLEGDIEAALRASKLDTHRILDDTVLDDFGEADKRDALYRVQELVGRINEDVRRAGSLLGEDLTRLELATDTTFLLSEVRDTWTKQTSAYVPRHEHAIEEEIRTLGSDVRALRLNLARKVSEISR